MIGRLGLIADPLLGEDVVTQMHVVADAISKVENRSERASIAVDLFGNSGVQLVEMLERFGTATSRSFSYTPMATATAAMMAGPARMRARPWIICGTSPTTQTRERSHLHDAAAGPFH